MKPQNIRRSAILLVVLATSFLYARVSPTFIHRHLPDVQPKPVGLTEGAKGATFKPVVGEGDEWVRDVRSVARYGELTVEPGGASAIVNYPREEGVFFVLEGVGTLHYDNREAPLKKHDYGYLPANVKYGISNSTGQPVRVLMMGFRLDVEAPAPPELMMANSDEVKLQIFPQHGPTSQYRMLIGPPNGRQDEQLKVSRQIAGMYIIEFTAGGTNIPHNHPEDEEIYLLLQGHGDMVAGGGMDGLEGRHPAKAGDAYFIRMNATVGFYAGNKEGEPRSVILAVRSRVPRGRMRQSGD